jgi:hypothetical protein
LTLLTSLLVTIQVLLPVDAAAADAASDMPNCTADLDRFLLVTTLIEQHV